MSRTFASDNNSGVHPKVLEAIARANAGHARAYGDDEWTAQAAERFRAHFGPRAHAFPVFNGTAANVLCLAALAPRWGAVLCAEGSHIAVDECGAPERFAAKLVTLPAPDGKLRPADVRAAIRGVGDVHHVQPAVVSIAQCTELGTVYTSAEVRALADVAHEHGLLLHMDGARLANAAASLGVPLRALTTDAGVDALSFGGTKNGCLGAEAVVLFDETRAKDFPYARKQAMQLASKMRFASAQFLAYFEDNLWLHNARHANAMAARLSREAAKVPGVDIVVPTQANEVFARLPAGAIAPLQAERYFYVWDAAKSWVRWVCSFDTTEEDVDSFVGALRRLVGAGP